jgi:hypothetical protein
MTAKQVQIRGDTNTNLLAATPAVRELGANTTKKRIHLGDGTTAGGIPHPNIEDIQNGNINFATAGGTADVLTVNLDPAATAYSTGGAFKFKAAANNTGAVTISLNGLTAKTCKKKQAGSLVDLEADDLINGGLYEAVYDGTYLQIAALDANASALGGGWELLAVATGGGSSYDFDGVISTDYDSYAFVFENVLPDTNLAALGMRIKRSGQPAYDTGATDYSSMTTSTAYSGSNQVVTEGNPSGSGAPSVGYMRLCNGTGASTVRLANSANLGTGFSGVLYAPGLGKSQAVVFHGSGGAGRDNGGGTYHGMLEVSSTGMRETTTAITAVRFLMSTGNITSGNIYMYGIRTAL